MPTGAASLAGLEAGKESRDGEAGEHEQGRHVDTRAPSFPAGGTSGSQHEASWHSPLGSGAAAPAAAPPPAGAGLLTTVPASAAAGAPTTLSAAAGPWSKKPAGTPDSAVRAAPEVTSAPAGAPAAAPAPVEPSMLSVCSAAAAPAGCCCCCWCPADPTTEGGPLGCSKKPAGTPAAAPAAPADWLLRTSSAPALRALPARWLMDGSA